jgi:hypothetical protein
MVRLLWISVCTSVELVPSCSRFQQSNGLTHLKPRWPKKHSSERHPAPAHDHAARLTLDQRTERCARASPLLVPVLQEIQSRNIHSSRQEGNRALCRPCRTWPTRESAGKAEASLTCPLLGSSRSADASETQH